MSAVVLVGTMVLGLAFVSAVFTGEHLGVSALVFGPKIVQAAWDEGKDGAAPTRVIGVATLLACWQLTRSAVDELRKANAKQRLVTTGPYAWTRQPFFLGVLGMLLSLSLVFDSLWVALWSGLLVWHMVTCLVPEEEALLAKTFPHAFHIYSQATPRWLRLPSVWEHTTAVRSLTATQKSKYIQKQE